MSIAKSSTIDFYDFDEKYIHLVVDEINRKLASGKATMAIVVKVPQEALDYISKNMNATFKIKQEKQPSSRTSRSTYFYTVEITNPKHSELTPTRTASFDEWLQKGGYAKKSTRAKKTTKKTA
jgi:hypothetical protein